MKSGEFIDAVRESTTPEQVLGVVVDRVKDLESSVEPVKFVAGGDKITYRYIHPESAVKAYVFSKGFRVNDNRVHEQFAQEVIKVARYDAEPDEIVLNASMLTTLKYFRQPGDEKRRRKMHGGLFRGNVQDLSTIRDGSAAMCVEMASVSHNLNMIGGVVSAFMIGSVDSGNGPGGHAWQLVRQGDENKIFDVTKTVPEESDDGHLFVHPYTGNVDALKLLTGNVVTVNPEVPEELAKSADYLFRSLAPTTFEGFAKLSFMEKAALSELSEREHMIRSVTDSVMQFELSDFYKAEM